MPQYELKMGSFHPFVHPKWCTNGALVSRPRCAKHAPTPPPPPPPTPSAGRLPARAHPATRGVLKLRTETTGNAVV